MTKNIRFLAFDNGMENWRRQEEIKSWKELSTEVIEARKGKPAELVDIDAEIISKIEERLTDWCETGSFGRDGEYSSLYEKKLKLNQKQEVIDYRENMHKAKGSRQKIWIQQLMNTVLSFFDEELKKYKNTTENDIFVLMLPEFFWADIVDHIQLYHIKRNDMGIAGYVSPLYEESYKLLLDSGNIIAKWMKDQKKNIIFFAGTAMHKEINDDPMKEKIYNTLLIYSVKKDDAVQISTWNKVNYSPIDGFMVNGHVVRNKIPHEEKKEVIGVGEKALEKPSINYEGLVFSFDICLDYAITVDGYSESRKLLNPQEAEFNILIAGGMPIMNPYDSIEKKSANCVVRCDKEQFQADRNIPWNEACCSVRVGETIQDMNVIDGTRIRYVNFKVYIEGNSKKIVMVK